MSVTDLQAATDNDGHHTRAGGRGPAADEPAVPLAGDPAPPRSVEPTGAPVVSRPRTAHHWWLLVGAAIVMTLSVILELRGTQHVGFPGLARPLPGVCWFRAISHLPCPGCGLTRSFISISHGDLAAAWRFNPSGLLLFVVVAGQIPYRAVQLWRLRRGLGEYHWTAFEHFIVWAMVVFLLGQWMVRLILGVAT